MKRCCAMVINRDELIVKSSHGPGLEFVTRTPFTVRDLSAAVNTTLDTFSTGTAVMVDSRNEPGVLQGSPSLIEVLESQPTRTRISIQHVTPIAAWIALLNNSDSRGVRLSGKRFNKHQGYRLLSVTSDTVGTTLNSCTVDGQGVMEDESLALHGHWPLRHGMYPDEDFVDEIVRLLDTDERIAAAICVTGVHIDFYTEMIEWLRQNFQQVQRQIILFNNPLGILEGAFVLASA